MSKRCICEICTCGRHRCPHRPTDHIGRGNGDCKLSEYTQVYKPHPLHPREAFRPAHEPIKGGPFEDSTTNRVDYRPHDIERPFQHKPDEYIKPQGEFDGHTSYKQEYVAKHGAPARAIRNEGQRPVPGRFEGEPTYKADYRKWEGAQKPQPYGMQAAWEPPKARFEGDTTFQSDYRRKEIPMRQSFKPNEGAKMSDVPFEDRTINRDTYIQHAMPQKFMRERDQYQPPQASFEGLTTFKRDYKGAPGEPTHSFKPEGQAFASDAPFEDGTTNRYDYKKWPISKPFVHAQEAYIPPQGEMANTTTTGATYVPMPLQRNPAMRPVSAKKASAPFQGQSSYNADYIRKVGDRARVQKQPDYVENTAPFEGYSTYQGHYVPHAMQPTKTFRPDQGAFRSDARFDDNTNYRTDYTPKEIHICEAAVIDQPTSRFRFDQLDNRGHKQYVPMQTTITPLKSGSPMQSQQRLAMSVA